MSRTVIPPRGIELDLDAAGMPGHSLVHGIVEKLGNEMMQRIGIRSTDIHAWPSTHGLESFEDLDILGGIFVTRRPIGQLEKVVHAAPVPAPALDLVAVGRQGVIYPG